MNHVNELERLREDRDALLVAAKKMVAAWSRQMGGVTSAEIEALGELVAAIRQAERKE